MIHVIKKASLVLAAFVGMQVFGGENPNELDRKQRARLYLKSLRQRLGQASSAVAGAALLPVGPASSLLYGAFAGTPAAFAFSAARGPAYVASATGAYLLYRFYNNNVRGVNSVIKARTAPYRAAHQQKFKAFRDRTSDFDYYGLGW